MIRTSIATILLASFLIGLATAADEPSSGGSAEQKERLESMKRQAAEYEVTLDRSPAVRLVLHGEPLLRFNNAVGDVLDGIAVMWKEGERPAVFAQIFLVKDGTWIHECQSVASAGFSMSAGERMPWQPEKAAQEFTKVPDAPSAAKGAVQRLVQMKEQAGRFSALDDFKMRANDVESSRYELRLLARPVYRYKDAKHGINDGAVFVFVHGTDPELFLILEHRGEGDKAGWYYSLAPMTCYAVTARLDGREIWSVPNRHGKTTPRDAYYVWVHQPEK
ncbi:MAG TPA: hypothetical protein VH592_16710 [Gemmataceae bacterium]|jgi:hypothetical protein